MTYKVEFRPSGGVINPDLALYCLFIFFNVYHEARGMPFAFLTCGLLSGPSAISWITKWLNFVRAAIQRTSEAFPGFVPDVFLRMCGPNSEHPMFVSPMPRSQGILILRKFLQVSSPNASLVSIGAPSPKVTFLSCARQVGASEE